MQKHRHRFARSMSIRAALMAFVAEVAAAWTRGDNNLKCCSRGDSNWKLCRSCGLSSTN